MTPPSIGDIWQYGANKDWQQTYLILELTGDPDDRSIAFSGIELETGEIRPNVIWRSQKHLWRQLA